MLDSFTSFIILCLESVAGVLGTRSSEELYDHAKDKWEWKNLANNPEYAAIKKRLREDLPMHHEPVGHLEAIFEKRK